MTADVFKQYLKSSYKRLILSVIFAALICWYIHEVWWIVIYFILGVSRDIYHFEENLERRKKLKAKGLTEEDIRNITFVQKWEETRKGGLWKYCVRDGGIITGAGLALALSLVYAILFSHSFKNILAEPGSMFSFIGYAYISGAIIGVIMFRILWLYKEKRFARLTDPLNNILKNGDASGDESL
ncbi:MAG TPA: hypothetical protein VIM89_01040 [Mucilaginibacter sp.]